MEQVLTFKQLLYRYFFFEWLFKDVSKGTIFERSLAWRHNKEMSKWLPTYMRRWIVLGFIFYALGFLFEMIIQLPIVSAFFYVPCTLALPFNSVALVSYFGFKFLPPPI